MPGAQHVLVEPGQRVVGQPTAYDAGLLARVHDDGEHLVALRTVVLVGGDHHCQVTGLPVGSLPDPAQISLQPRVGSGQRAVVGVVAEVRYHHAGVGELTAVDISPDGVVLLRGARWRARTNRATPIEAGDPVKVVAVEGLVLEVEPPEGGAQDYRERARNRRSKSQD